MSFNIVYSFRGALVIKQNVERQIRKRKESHDVNEKRSRVAHSLMSEGKCSRDRLG
jgi:hypothetical protein